MSLKCAKDTKRQRFRKAYYKKYFFIYLAADRDEIQRMVPSESICIYRERKCRRACISHEVKSMAKFKRHKRELVDIYPIFANEIFQRGKERV